MPGRGRFTGNRGCLVDAGGEVVRHHRGSSWIVCLLEYRGWRAPLAAPGRWTPVFFLDDAVALAAGHRPCGLCRRDAYRSYRDAVTRAVGADAPLRSTELDRRLGPERRRPRRPWPADVRSLPVGTVVVADGRAHLVLADRLRPFSFDGWGEPVDRPRRAEVAVLTPPASVAALASGYEPVLAVSGGR